MQDGDILKELSDIKRLLIFQSMKNGSNASEIGKALGVSHMTILRLMGTAKRGGK